jgi:hypothetical protein
VQDLSRLDFLDLPAPVRRAITTQTGTVRSDRTVHAGRNSAVASILDTEQGQVFVKGVPLGDARVAGHRREAAISPYVPHSCPRLLWSVEAAGWSLLGYEAIDGRHADYTRGVDLRRVMDALDELSHQTAPTGLDLKTAEQRWGSYADEGEAERFAGPALLHTDLRPENVILADGRACLIDWAWPTRGAAWIEPYLWALHIVAAGQSPAAAVSWARQLWSWRDADPSALCAFGAAVARRWHEIATEESSRWKIHMAACAAELRAFLVLDAGLDDQGATSA